MAEDGQASRILSDDRAGDGGTGRIGRAGVAEDLWQMTAYDPAFETPDWAPGSVVYQVFPDRYANADPANDPSPDATPGPPAPRCTVTVKSTASPSSPGLG